MFQKAFPMLESDSLFIARRVGIYHDKSENKGENGRFLSYIELGWVMGEGEAFTKILNSPPTRKKTKNKKKNVYFPPKETRVDRGNIFVIRVTASLSHFP